MSAFFPSSSGHPALYSDSAAAGNMLYLNHPLYQDSSAGSNLQHHLHPHSGILVPLPPFPQAADDVGTGHTELSLHPQLLDTVQQHQGLSLSLGMQMPVPVYQPRAAITSGGGQSGQTHVSIASYGHSAVPDAVTRSRYLKAAQELLAEVVNVGDAIKKPKVNKSGSKAAASGGNSDSKETGMGSEAAPAAELTPSERQEVQNKVTRLVAMLDEADQRYRQYYHQMQIVMSSFDVVAGAGSARPYTALALQTISRHFRGLRDAISGQIQLARRSLGEQDTSSHGAGGGISRLRYIDQQIRAQREAQQFGVPQPQAWRPQRGLPESSVSVLRAWLFEHFLHPYPKDSEKLMLARQTGLSRSQVSNWFINARVRLWKPMIEDMYKDEIGHSPDADLNSSSDAQFKSAGKNDVPATEKNDYHELPSPSAADVSYPGHATDFSKPEQDPPASVNDFANVAGTVTAYSLASSLGHHRWPPGEAGNLLQEAIPHQGFMNYHLMPELGRYDSGGVSLTLGLQHCNGVNEPAGLSAVHRDDIYVAPSGAVDYDHMASSENHQRFNSPMLHDFVA